MGKAAVRFLQYVNKTIHLLSPQTIKILQQKEHIHCRNNEKVI